MQYGKTDCYDLYFFYDDNDQPLGFYYTDVFTSGRGRKFYFVLNAQGDVVQLRDQTNQTVANYHYDAWGKLLSITDPDGIVNETLSMKEEWERYFDKQKEYYQKICMPNILPALLYPLITHHSDCFYIEIRQ